MNNTPKEAIKSVPYAEMVRALCKPGQDILSSLSPNDCHKLHMASALLGETVELLDAEDLPNAEEELGDIEFFFEGLRQGYGVDWCHIHDVMRQPFEKGMPTMKLIITAGVLYDLVKKETIYRKIVHIDQIASAMTRLDECLTDVRHLFKFNRGDVLKANQRKLAVRYADFVYTDKRAQERADKPVMPESDTQAHVD